MISLIPNFWTFATLTLVIGGAGALVTGRAMARTWRSPWQVIAYMLPLGAGVRFLHYALFQETTNVWQAALCFGALALLALAGFAAARRRQMRLQYPWIANS